MKRIVCVTPAGRRRYLELLAKYILPDPAVAEWQLWDNCREPRDRNYIEGMAAQHQKIRIVRLPNSKGDNLSISKFYGLLDDPDAFYVKLDDDLVWFEPNFFTRFLEKASAYRSENIWFSPLVINNAICTWLMKVNERLKISQSVSAQAGCQTGWRNWEFAVLLHKFFIDAVKADKFRKLQVPDFELSGGRFSINCIGFFGSDRVQLGDRFCPPDVDDEEYISATLPFLTKRKARVIGSEIVVHYGYATQEIELLKTDILREYYSLAGLAQPRFQHPKLKLKQATLRAFDNYRLRLRDKTPLAWANSFS